MNDRKRRLFLPALLVAVVASHALLATVYVPVHSDIHVYRLYAESVARGIEDGTSAAVARDEIILDNARRDGRPEPAPSAFLVEYPPVAVLWMAASAIGMSLGEAPEADPEAYADRFRVAMFAVFLLTLLVLIRWATPAFVSPSNRERYRGWRIAVFAMGSLILGNLLFDRLDLVVGALLLVGVVLLARGRWLSSFVVLAVAINFKASPIALAPLWVIASLPVGVVASVRADPGALVRSSVIRTVALAGLTLLIFLPFVVIEGTRALDFLRFRAIQGVHIESIPGSILLILQQVGLPLEVTSTFGTFELQTPLSSALATASPVVLVVAAAAVLVLYVRSAIDPSDGPTSTASPPERTLPAPGGSLAVPTTSVSLAVAYPQLLLIATVATLLVTLVTSKLLSPQYLLWTLPLVPLLEFRGVPARAFQLWFLLTCALSTVIFPYLLGRTLARQDPAGDGYLDPTPLGVGLVVARNALLIWLAWLAIRALRPAVARVHR